MKPASFTTFKKVQKMSLNQFNRWAESVYKHGAQDAIDYIEEQTVAELYEDDLYAVLLSVKGIGEKRANEVMSKITGWRIDESKT